MSAPDDREATPPAPPPSADAASTPRPSAEPAPGRSSPALPVAEPLPGRSSPALPVADPAPGRSSPALPVADPAPGRSSPALPAVEPALRPSTPRVRAETPVPADRPSSPPARVSGRLRIATPPPGGEATVTVRAGPPILMIDQLSVRRGGRTVIDDVSLEIAPGEIVGVVGKNGCGKSTLLACVAGVLAPRDGVVRVDGASVWGARRDRRRARRALGYVPEAADPPGFLLATELWSLCASTRGANPPSQALRDALGLDELRDLALDRMSLGQRRRACLGAALVGSPKLLVLDEPDNGLDARRLDAIVGLLRGHAADGGATVLASHDAALLDQLGARIMAMTA